MNKKELYNLEKEQNILLCAKLFLENDYYIIDIANIIKKSTSTVQRYLNDPYIEIKLGKDIKELIELKLKAKKQKEI